MEPLLFFVFAVLFLVLTFLAPQLVRLRIRVLRWIHWDWAANLLEDYFDRWVWFFRFVLLILSAILFVLGWRGPIDL